jgi:hypothetical protein
MFKLKTTLLWCAVTFTCSSVAAQFSQPGYPQQIASSPYPQAPSAESQLVKFQDSALQHLRNIESYGNRASRSIENTGISFSGWVTHGYTGNPSEPVNGSNLPTGFSDQANKYLMNQLYIIAEADLAPQKEDWSANARLDILYGSDYFFTMAQGLETNRDGTPHWNSSNGPRFNSAGSAALYGLAMPQFYIDAETPIAGGLGIKAGHFYSPLSGESVMSASNFFSSHSLGMLFGTPRTHTGLVATKQLDASSSFQLGLTRGWDNLTDDNNQVSLLAGVQQTSEYGHFEFNIHAGDDTATSDRLTIMTLRLEREVSGRLGYGALATFGVAENGLSNVSAGTFKPAKWYGVAHYFIYDINDKIDAGLRVEWFYDESNSRIMGVPIQDLYEGGQYANITLGANIQASKGFLIRPELRWDWSNTIVNGAERPFVDFSKDSQITLSFDIIHEF